MLERKYDPSLPYKYVAYGRMSDPRQNKRSPDQQFITISETITRCGYPWVCIGTHRDDGISGQYLRKRPGLQRLLRDIEVGLLQVDLIAVDTLERLGRSDEIAEIRRKLFIQHGVLVVAADNNFADPTGVVGKAVGLVENIRSTEDGRIKAHNVLRGKKDAARLKRWPGGPPPFGRRLKAVVNESVSPTEVYSVLETEPRAAAALALAFARAAETGEGDMRLSQWWNSSPEIPDDMKPISPYTMGYRLSNPIAIGTLRWGKNRTGVVNDMRVVEANPDGAEMIPNFCPPIIDVELYERVQQLRRTRSEQIRRLRQQKARAGKEESSKLIAPQFRGLTLKYLLTGLVRCGICNASLRPVPSGRLSNAGRRYAYYTCPRHYERACSNDRHVPEDRLRAAVLSRLRWRLFPTPEQPGQTPPWLDELLSLVRQEWQRYQEHEPDRLAAVEEELRHLEHQLAGWATTLGNPQLSAMVRADIETHYGQGKQRQQELLQSVAAQQAWREHMDRILDVKVVLSELQRLDEVLAQHNPTLGNLELSKHIDAIVCYPDGRVELRGTYVGIFAGAVELLSRTDEPKAADQAPAREGGFKPVKRRRRGQLRLPSLSAGSQQDLGDIDTSLDPERFAGLPEPLVWSEAFVLAKKQSWAEAHATEVAQKRASGMTMEELARHYRKSVPTVRQALQHAKAKDPSLTGLPTKMPRRRWEEDHAAEVAALRSEGWTLKELASHSRRSEPTIRKALQFAAERRITSPGEGADSADQT